MFDSELQQKNYWTGDIKKRKIFLSFYVVSCIVQGISSFLQIMVIDYKLTYPSGTATAVLINSFHTPEGADVARWADVD